MSEKASRREFLKMAGVGVAGLAVGLAAGYGLAPKGPAEVAPAPQAKKPIPSEPIKIGHIDSLSGPAAIFGKPQVNGMELAVEMINEQGGILGRKVELIVRDDAGKPDVAVEQAKRLIEEEKVDFLTGITSSGVALALAPLIDELVEKHKRGLMFAIDGCTWRLTKDKVYKYYFVWAKPDIMEAVYGAYLALKLKPDLKRVAHISPDYAYGRDEWEAFITVLQGLKPDVEVVAEAWPPLYTKDYTAHISKIIAAKPELVWSTLWGGDFVTFTKQASGYGFFKDRIFIDPIAGDTILSMKKEEVPEGLVLGPHNYYFLFPPWNKWPLNKEFNERYMRKYGEPPHQGSAGALFILNALKTAIEKAYALKGEWPEVDDIVEVLEGLGVLYPGCQGFVREDRRVVMAHIYGYTKHDPRYDFPILDPDRLEVISAEFAMPPLGPLDVVKWIKSWAKA